MSAVSAYPDAARRRCLITAPGYSDGVAVRTLQAMLAFVRDGDTVVVHSMDRLARNLDDLRRLVAS